MNSNPQTHWTDEALLGLLYGLTRGPDQDQHPVESCPDCLARLETLRTSRQAIVAGGDVSEDFLRAQRRAIYQRIENRKRAYSWSWRVPLGATAMVVALAVFLYRPAPPPPAEPAVLSDAQFFSELAAEASGREPRAAEPIHGLFAETE